MSSAAGSLAKISRPPEEELESRESAPGSGLSLLALLARFDPASRSLKIPQLSLFEASGSSLETWPQWGLMRDGECWALDHLAPHMSGGASGLSGETLRWDTPCSGDAHPRAYARKGPYLGKGQKHLQAQAFERLTELDSPNGKLNPEWVEWLMGWPMGWTALEPLETDRFRQWLEAHGESLEE